MRQSSVHDKEAAPTQSQQCGCLNKACTVTPAADMSEGMSVTSQGAIPMKSYKQTMATERGGSVSFRDWHPDTKSNLKWSENH